ncbi:MAG: hypothetical protein ABI183_05455 [Polyangiaceae bacterium]
MKSLLWGLPLLPLTLLACGSSGSGTGANGSDGGMCGSSSTGSLTVSISGLPAGVDAKVNLVPSSGASQTITASTNAVSEPSGSYTVTADIVTQADTVVRKAFKGTVSVASAQVCDGQATTITVTYAQIATSNKLWWGNENGTTATLGYASSNVTATGSPPPDISAQTEGALGEFDHDGNMWAIDGVSKSIKRYTADSLSSSGPKTPDIEITSEAFTGGAPGPATLTLDANGYMYVGVTYSKSIAVIGPDSLKASGSVMIGTTITTPDAPNAVAFDNLGNLWVACGNDRVVKYSNPRNGGTTPDVTIEAQTAADVDLTSPLGLAFDINDNLWVDYNGTMARLTPTERAGTGDIKLSPAKQVTSDVLSLPGGIAFDETGGLWFAYSAGKFARFSQAQLTSAPSAAAVAPDLVITSTGVGSALSPQIYPAPAGTPLVAAVK